MSEFVDPAQFVITRKRKKYKFAKFHNAENCFEFDEFINRSATSSRHGLEQNVDVLEIGAGDGRFSVALAARHPELQFVALDVKADRLQKGAYDALEQKLENVSFVRARADQIGELFAPGSLSAIWLTFSDPFPRKRSAGRRLTHPNFLARYRRLLRKSPPRGPSSNRGKKVRNEAGVLYIKHDNPEFFHWSLEQLVAEKWHIDELSFDLHDSALPDEYKIVTAYEQRWLGEGRTPMFVAATKI